MLKKDLLDLIFNFEKETWKYNSNENLDQDMDYIYSIENAIKNASDTNLKLLYDRLVALIGIIRLKYGFESIVINSIPELENLQPDAVPGASDGAELPRFRCRSLQRRAVHPPWQGRRADSDTADPYSP